MSGGFYDYVPWKEIIHDETLETLIRVSRDMRKEGITGDILHGIEYVISHAAKAKQEKERIVEILHKWGWYKSSDIDKNEALTEIDKYKFYIREEE